MSLSTDLVRSGTNSIKPPLRFGLAISLCLAASLFPTGCGVTLGAPATPPTQTPPVQPPPSAGGAGSVAISPLYVALSPGQTTHFTATASGPVTWLVNGASGGSAATGTVDSSGNYTAPLSLTQSENVSITAQLTSSPQQDYATSVASIIAPGLVYPTANPQVVQYSIYLPAPGKVSVQFGLTTDYGFNTWQVPAPTNNGGQVSIYVAGMLAEKLYHMRAQVVLDDGATLADPDQSRFASGQPLATGIPPATNAIVVSTPGTPQPGIEMWNSVLPNTNTAAYATDLQGNVIWTYTFSGSNIDLLQGIQLLPDGNFLMVISYLSSLGAGVTKSDPGTIDVVREVDLVGNTIREISMDTLNQKLAAAGFHDSAGSPYQLKSFHHHVLALPNGHWVLLAADAKNFSDLPGYPGTTSVLGDVLVDVDQNSNPDWVWSAFDHLDVNRHPMNFPDWTHSNDLLYSSDDHNLLLSIRHQNWIVKIDFDDGHGSGNVLWRLGEGGDFKLVGGTDPTDWFYAQHGMGYFSQNTTGVFRLGLMDNGNDRIFPSGQVLCTPKTPINAQCYSTAPVFEIDEANMTATLLTNYNPPTDFSYFGGNVEQLANGDMHVDFCGIVSGSLVQELNSAGSQVVWQATTPKSNQFRVDRLPSLYPGVQW
jgi:arylsulfate sulfotransferase